MQEIILKLQQSGTHSDGTPRLRVATKDGKILLDKYAAFQIVIKGKLIPIKVRSDRRIEIPANQTRQLGLKKGKIKVKIASSRDLPFDQRTITKRRILRIASRQVVTKEKVLNFPMTMTVNKERVVVPPYILKEYFDEIKKFILQCFNAFDRNSKSHEFFATLIIKVNRLERYESGTVPMNTKITTRDWNPVTEKGGRHAGLKYVIEKIEEYLIDSYAVALNSKDLKKVTIWKISYTSRRMLRNPSRRP